MDYASFARQVGFHSYGHVLDVKVAGNNAYLACQLGSNGYHSGNGFKIIDITDPASPSLTSYLDLPAPRDIALAGSYALVADALEDLVVIDISGGASLVSKLQLPGESKAIAAWGTFAFVGLDVGLRKIDLTTPASPKIVKFLSTHGPVQALFQSEDLLYVAEGDSGLEVIDPNFMLPLGHVDTPGSAFGVTASGNYVFVADQLAGVQVIDVSDPQTPHIVGTFDPVADGLYPTDTIFDVSVVGNLLVIAHGYGLRILDISNPVTPVPICRVVVGLTMWSVFANNTYAYLGGENGLFVFDIHNPYSPPILGESASPFAGAVALSGMHAYVADGEAGLRILDVSNPSLPTPTGGYGIDMAQCKDVTVDGDRAYVTNGRRGLLIFDVSDPKNPVLLGEASTPGHAQFVAVESGFAYVSDDIAGLQIFDVSNPASPNIVASVDSNELVGGYVSHPGFAGGVAVRNGFAYLAVSDGYPGLDIHTGGFYVINVANPYAPSVVGRMVRPDMFYVALSGNYAYVTGSQVDPDPAMSRSDFSVIDISNPSSPTRVGSRYLTGGRCSTYDNIVYVADGARGVQVVDVSNPQSPSLIGRVSPNGYASDAKVSGGLVYDANGSSGLVVLPTHCPAIVPVSLLSFRAGPMSDGILLTWTVANGAVNVGFHVERSTKVDGQYERLTSTLLPPQVSYRFVDRAARAGIVYYYRLLGLDRAGGGSYFGPVSASREALGIQTTLGLSRPNPFATSTLLEFTMAAHGRARIRVLDPAGRQVRLVCDAQLEAGAHAVPWDGRDDQGRAVGAGVYFYRLDTDAFSGSRMVLRVP